MGAGGVNTACGSDIQIFTLQKTWFTLWAKVTGERIGSLHILRGTPIHPSIWVTRVVTLSVKHYGFSGPGVLHPTRCDWNRGTYVSPHHKYLAKEKPIGCVWFLMWGWLQNESWRHILTHNLGDSFWASRCSHRHPLQTPNRICSCQRRCHSGVREQHGPDEETFVRHNAIRERQCCCTPRHPWTLQAVEHRRGFKPSASWPQRHILDAKESHRAFQCDHVWLSAPGSSCSWLPFRCGFRLITHNTLFTATAFPEGLCLSFHHLYIPSLGAAPRCGFPLQLLSSYTSIYVRNEYYFLFISTLQSRNMMLLCSSHSELVGDCCIKQ